MGSSPTWSAQLINWFLPLFKSFFGFFSCVNWNEDNMTVDLFLVIFWGPSAGVLQKFQVFFSGEFRLIFKASYNWPTGDGS